MMQDEDAGEVRERAVERLDEVLASAGIRFGPDLPTRRAALAETSVQQWEALLMELNAAARDRVAVGHGHDGGRVMTATMVPVPESDRRDALRRLFSRVQQELMERSLDDRAALDTASALLAVGIPDVHAFANGNGRTARVLLWAVRYGMPASIGEREADLREIVVERRGGAGISQSARDAVWRAACAPAVRTAQPWEPDVLEYGDLPTTYVRPWLEERGYSRAEAERCAVVLGDNRGRGPAVGRVLRDHGLERLATSGPVDPEKLLQQLGAGAVDALESAWRDFRREEFDVTLEALAAPESLSVDGPHLTVRANFEYFAGVHALALHAARSHPGVEDARAARTQRDRAIGR